MSLTPKEENGKFRHSPGDAGKMRRIFSSRRPHSRENSVLNKCLFAASKVPTEEETIVTIYTFAQPRYSFARIQRGFCERGWCTYSPKTLTRFLCCSPSSSSIWFSRSFSLEIWFCMVSPWTKISLSNRSIFCVLDNCASLRGCTVWPYLLHAALCRCFRRPVLTGLLRPEHQYAIHI